ncbi:copper chaperone PCu(A)C [Gordonia sp. IITR100]|uniref:copper chaperone PCu(A)C n=1 Tax=Gordonia sp. IITR100 TaxID=1314686 RepID=UPI000990DCB2|nr:copper chaperone PCu(A)C [Gordonia sp. IITR100]
MPVHHRNRSLSVVSVVAVLSALFALAGCSSEPARESTQSAAVAITDSWIKGMPAGMTSVYATIANDSDSDVRVVSASSPVAGRAELHEMVSDGGIMSMRIKPEGLIIPARQTTTLGPGDDHLMLFDLRQPITPGSSTTVTLRFEDESSVDFTAQGRDFPGASERYEPNNDEHAPHTQPESEPGDG